MSLKDTVRGWLRSTEELASADRLKHTTQEGFETIAECTDRSVVALRGTIALLTVRPQGNTKWLEAELTDGTGTVRLIWMGRRAIAGIDAGRDLVVEGRISVSDGERRMYNPRYELR